MFFFSSSFSFLGNQGEEEGEAALVCCIVRSCTVHDFFFHLPPSLPLPSPQPYIWFWLLHTHFSLPPAPPAPPPAPPAPPAPAPPFPAKGPSPNSTPSSANTGAEERRWSSPLPSWPRCFMRFMALDEAVRNVVENLKKNQCKNVGNGTTFKGEGTSKRK